MTMNKKNQLKYQLNLAYATIYWVCQFKWD